MSDVLARKIEAAKSLSLEASRRLASLGQTEVADSLASVISLLCEERFAEAFVAYRQLPMNDVSGLRDHLEWDWMTVDSARAPVGEMALAAAYYQQARAAIGDLRVSMLYGFDRPVVPSSAEHLQALADAMAEPANRRHAGT